MGFVDKNESIRISPAKVLQLYMLGQWPVHFSCLHGLLRRFKNPLKVQRSGLLISFLCLSDFVHFRQVCNKPAVRASGSGQTLFLHEHHPRSPSSLCSQCRPSLSAKTQKQQPPSLSESFVALRSSRLGGGPEGVTSLSGHECSRTSLTAVKTSPLQLFYKRARNTRPVIPDRFSPPRYRFYRYSSS